MTHPTRTTVIRPSVLLLLLAVLLAACSPTASPAPIASSAPSTAPTSPASPSPSSAVASPSASTGPVASVDIDATYDQIESEVVQIRGLDPVDVARKTIGAAELQRLNQQDFDKDNPPEYVAANERLYKSLGLLAPDQSLRDLFLKLIDSQVAGFYRPDEKTLYVVSRSGAVNGADKITFAHEYTHALQDHSFPKVFSEQDRLREQSDEALARSSIFEGDATILMSLWALQHLSPQELQDVQAAGSDPESTAILAATPGILRNTLLFPYNTGVSFLTPKQLQAGWPGVDAVYDRLPVSTEQVLHPEKYDAKEAPIKVTIPSSLAKDLGTGWKVTLQDTFGEFQTKTWLQETGLRDPGASDAAAGWGGDRLAVLEGPDGAWATAWHTEWDTAADAAAFETAATTALGAAGGPAKVLPGTGGTTRWVVVGSDDAVLSKVANALGLAG